MNQVTFEIRPNGATVEITMRGEGFPQAGQVFPRPVPNVAANDLDVFRTGDAKPKEIDDLQKQVSDWLLSHDLKPVIDQWLQPRPERLRMVFSVDSRVQLALDDLPFELIRTDPGSDPVVVQPQIESFVYLLPKVRTLVSTATLDWPMRVLLVRSNPADLGGKVPPAAPIRDKILALANQQFGSNMVQVDLLSSEPGALRRPTWEDFKRTAQSEYDVMVYLGHGDLQLVHKDLPPVAQLQFESIDPQYHDSVSSKQLAIFLSDNPIPAVVLAGCMTAAAPGVSPPGLATWMRGNQGMAQALVNSASGVVFAVGMRCKVEDSDASAFIAWFFQNLFEKDKGNLERAVRAARRELYGAKSYSSSWAAPVVFSSLPTEPVFEYLTRPPGIKITDAINRELELRRVIWLMLADSPPAGRQAALTDLVKNNRNALELEILKQGAMLSPEVVDGVSGQTVSVPVSLTGQLSCTYFQARLSVGAGLKVGAAHATPILSQAGFQVLNDLSEPGVFQIQKKDRNNKVKLLPSGKIVNVEVTVAPDAGRVCPLNLDSLFNDARELFWAGNSALIVPPLV